MLNRTIIVDVETKTFGTPDATKDVLRYVGIRLPTGQHLVYGANQIEQIQQVISQYGYIANHNLIDYDVPVLERHGIKFFTRNHQRHIFLDTWQILFGKGFHSVGRAKSMMYLDFPSGKRSLRYLAEFFNLPCKKGEFDYELLKKPMLTASEYKDMKEYLIGDLDTAFYLYKHLYDTFAIAQDYVAPVNVTNMTWLTCSSGTLGYKIFCHQKGVREIYAKNPIRTPFGGAWMWVPQDVNSAEDIIVLDFEALYPNIKKGLNLSNRVKLPQENNWNATGTIFEGFVKGTYTREWSTYEQSIHDRIIRRREVKAKMKLHPTGTPENKALWFAQNGIKITLNSEYGAGGNPVFQSMYDHTVSGDTTGGAKACITHAKQTFESLGYKVIYIHTDSLYVQDHLHDKDKILQIAKDISELQRKDMNIYNDTHNLNFESHLKKMWLVKDEKGTNVRNRNIRLYQDDSVGYTGIKLIATTCSPIAIEVFKKHITPDIVAMKNELFYKPQCILDWIKELAEDKPELLEKRYKVKDIKEYKTTTSIQAQISIMFGAGEHYLVDNKFIGAGKSKKYAPIKLLKEKFGEEWIESLKLKGNVNDLSEFILPTDRKLISKLS